MATSCVLYRPEKTIFSANAPAEPWQNVRETTPTTFDTPNIHLNLRATLHDLTNVARDLPTEQALCLEIEKLCTATLAIDQAFYDIGRRLSDATKEQNKRVELYDACYALESQWNEHHLVGLSIL